MIEYPSITNSSKAPRKYCVAFDKRDGSNFRAKWTNKRGFDTFGTRTQLIDATTEFWGEMVELFNEKYNEFLDYKFRHDKQFRNEREIIVFAEFLGEHSFAGRHENEPHDLVFFDILVGHKNRKFIPPLDFVREFQDIVPIPHIIYVGNLNEKFIQDIRNDIILDEGVICKGTEPRGDYIGSIWTCKIKTNRYFEKLKELHGEDWKKYWE